MRFRDLPAELGRQDGTPEITPRDCRGRWEWCLPASPVLFLPRLGRRATAVGLRSRGSLGSWLRWSFTFSLMREFLPFHRMCNRVLRHACDSPLFSLCCPYVPDNPFIFCGVRISHSPGQSSSHDKNRHQASLENRCSPGAQAYTGPVGLGGDDALVAEAGCIPTFSPQKKKPLSRVLWSNILNFICHTV